MTDTISSSLQMTGLMKKAKGAENVGLGSVPKPAAGPGHVVIEVFATGICGTDLHIQHDEFMSDPPVVMGHEVTGRVVEAGAGAEEHLGKRVATETYFYTCDGCAACRAGRRNLCPERRSIGSHVNGGFARYLLVPGAQPPRGAPLRERARRRPLRAALVRDAVPVRPGGGLAR